MAVLKRRFKRTSQPQKFTRVNRANSFANNLIALINPALRQDVISGKPVAINGVVIFSPTPSGIGSAPTVSGGAASVSGGSANVGTGNLTDFVLLTGDAPTATFTYACGTFDGTSGTGITDKHGTIGGNWGIADVGSNLTNSLASSGEVFPSDGKTHLLIHTRDGTNHSLYRNGALKATVAGTNGNSSNASFVQNNLRATGDTVSTTRFALVSGRLNRALTANEVAKLTAEIWDLFDSSSRSAFLVEAAGSATVVDLSTASFGFIPKSLQLALSVPLSTANLKLTPQNPQLALKSNLTSANLSLTPQNVQLSLITRLTTAFFDFVGRAMDIGNAASGTVISLTTATFDFVAQPVQNKLVMNLATAALNFEAKQTTNSLALRLTAASLNFAAQPTNNTLRIVLSTALLKFTTNAITISGAIDSGVQRLRIMMGIGQ